MLISSSHGLCGDNGWRSSKPAMGFCTNQSLEQSMASFNGCLLLTSAAANVAWWVGYETPWGGSLSKLLSEFGISVLTNNLFSGLDALESHACTVKRKGGGHAATCL